MLNCSSFEDSSPEPVNLPQIQMTTLRSRKDRVPLTDRSSLTNDTARQYHCYHELRQTKKDLEFYKGEMSLDQTIRTHAQTTNCRQIFAVMDRFKESFRVMYQNEDTREQVPSLFQQLKRDLANIDGSLISSPCLQSPSSDDNSSLMHEARNLQLMETLYEKLAYIKELEKHVNLDMLNCSGRFTTLQKSGCVSPDSSHRVSSNVKVLQFEFESGQNVGTQTDPLREGFVQTVNLFKEVYKRYITSCNLVWKLIYKLVTPQAPFMEEYHTANNQLLLWYSRLRFKVQKYDFQEALSYMALCKDKARHLDDFVRVVNLTINKGD